MNRSNNPKFFSEIGGFFGNVFSTVGNVFGGLNTIAPGLLGIGANALLGAAFGDKAPTYSTNAQGQLVQNGTVPIQQVAPLQQVAAAPADNTALYLIGGAVLLVVLLKK